MSRAGENRSVPVSWTPDEPMSKEFALSSIRDIRRIFRMIYYQPQADVYGCIVGLAVCVAVLCAGVLICGG